VGYLPIKIIEILTCVTLNHTKEKELASFYNTIELNKIVCGVTYFRLFRHVTLHLVHWASNATAAIEIFPNAHQKKWRYIV